eukprot:356930-Chlamydomonas_euryale.AAC.5
MALRDPCICAHRRTLYPGYSSRLDGLAAVHMACMAACRMACTAVCRTACMAAGHAACMAVGHMARACLRVLQVCVLQDSVPCSALCATRFVYYKLRVLQDPCTTSSVCYKIRVLQDPCATRSVYYKLRVLQVQLRVLQDSVVSAPKIGVNAGAHYT